MTARDDALSWEGDDDPTHAADAPPSRAPRRRESAADAESADRDGTVDGRGGRDEPDGREMSVEHGDAVREERAQQGSAALVALGVLGGVYALYAVGWFVGGSRLVAVTGGGDVGTSIALAVAVASPLLWFVATWVCTRRSRPWLRFAWLVAGAVLLVPWPLLSDFAGAPLGAG